MRLPTCGAQVQNKGLTALWGNLKGPVSIKLTGPLFVMSLNRNDSIGDLRDTRGPSGQEGARGLGYGITEEWEGDGKGLKEKS